MENLYEAGSMPPKVANCNTAFAHVCRAYGDGHSFAAHKDHSPTVSSDSKTIDEDNDKDFILQGIRHVCSMYDSDVDIDNIIPTHQ